MTSHPDIADLRETSSKPASEATFGATASDAGLEATGEKFDRGKGQLVKARICSLRKSPAVYGVYGGTDDDVLHNYRVAKALEPIIWKKGEDKKLIACTYLGNLLRCGFGGGYHLQTRIGGGLEQGCSPKGHPCNHRQAPPNALRKYCK